MTIAKPFTLAFEQWVPRPLEEVFDFFSRPANLQTITPPLLNFHITDAPEQIQEGSLIRYRLRVHGVPVRWTTKIVEWNPPDRFVDIQLSGPYALWHHEHTFVAQRGGTALRDTVQYALPLGPLGVIANWMFVRRDIEKIFAYRSEKMREMFVGP